METTTTTTPATSGAPIHKLNRTNLRSKIEEVAGNKLVSVAFVKLDNQDRNMVFRLGVKKGLRGGQNKVEADDRSYMTVYDMKKGGFRTLNLKTVKTIRMGGKRYEVID